MRTLAYLVLAGAVVLVVAIPDYWTLWLCGGIGIAAACLSLAAGADKKALKEREVKALEELARQGKGR